MELQTSESLTPLIQVEGGAPSLRFVSPLVQLVRLRESGAPNFRFVNPLAQLVRLQVGHTAPNLRFVTPLPPFINSLGYKLEMDLQTSHLSTPLVQLVRVRVGNAAPHLRFVNPCHSTR